MSESSSTNQIRVSVAPGQGRISRRAGAVLFDPTGQHDELAARFDAAGDDAAALTLVKQYLIEREFDVEPLAVIDWNDDGLGLLLFGAVTVHTSSSAAPMISGAGSGTWIERRLGALELGDADEAQVWCGDETDSGTDLRSGMILGGGVRVGQVRFSTADAAQASADVAVNTNGSTPSGPEADLPAPPPVSADERSTPPPSPIPPAAAAEPSPSGAPVAPAPVAAPPTPPPPAPSVAADAPPMSPPPVYNPDRIVAAPPVEPGYVAAAPMAPAPMAPPAPSPLAPDGAVAAPPAPSPPPPSPAPPSPAPSSPPAPDSPAADEWTNTDPAAAASIAQSTGTIDPFTGEAGAGVVPASVRDTLPPDDEDAEDDLFDDSITTPAGQPIDLGQGEPGAGLVEAVMCANGHANPPQDHVCRTCASAIDSNAETALISQPGLGHVRFPDGTGVAMDKTHIIGRKPPVGLPGTQPVIVDHAEVSRAHVELRIDGWAVLVVDLGSRNGTWVVPPSDPTPIRLDEQVPYVLEHGTTVHLGGPEASFTYDFSAD